MELIMRVRAILRRSKREVKKAEVCEKNRWENDRKNRGWKICDGTGNRMARYGKEKNRNCLLF